MRFANPTSLTEQYQWIFPADDAYDHEAKDFADAYHTWLDTGDMNLLKPFAKEGHQPAIFTLRHLSPKQRRFIADVAEREGAYAAAYEAARLALVSIAVPDSEPPAVEHTFGRHNWETVNEETILMLDAADKRLVNTLGVFAIEKAHPSKN